MHAQGTNSPIFTPAPLDSFLTLPQLLDRQFEQSPHHTAYLYDAPGGEIISISFAQYIRTVYAACRCILHDTDTVPHTPIADGQCPVIRIFAATDMMVAATMRASLVPFCISPHNAAAGVADLLEKTAAVVYVSADRKKKLVEAFDICGKKLPVFDILTFKELQDGLDLEESSEYKSLPTLPAVIDLDSPGVPPQYSRSQAMILHYAADPWSGSEDHCGEILGGHILPNLFVGCLDSFHGMGLCLNIWPFSASLVMAVLRPSTPPIPLTPENALAGMLATKPNLVMATPAAIGGCSVFCIWHDWEYLAVRKELNAAEIKGCPGCSVSDLLEQHPDNPDLHRVYGHKDDLITLSTAVKINRNDVVDAAVIFGNNRPYPGVLIQLKQDFHAELSEDTKPSKICDILCACFTAPSPFSVHPYGDLTLAFGDSLLTPLPHSLLPSTCSTDAVGMKIVDGHRQTSLGTVPPSIPSYCSGP
ncbi:hypothetical protein B0H14DRAFT_2625801 [Mycena olivaceomarginata]|nr:hypothetical protein B0H14DRAFT_2625801 [Mycena olivaceomarginata]